VIGMDLPLLDMKLSDWTIPGLQTIDFWQCCGKVQQFITDLVSGVKSGHLPVEHLVVGGVLLGVIVLAFTRRRSKTSTEAVSTSRKTEEKTIKVASSWKRPEPLASKTGDEKKEIKQWKKPIGVKSSKTEETSTSLSSSLPWKKKSSSPKPTTVTVTNSGGFQKSQSVASVTEKSKPAGSFGGKTEEKKEEQKSSWFGGSKTKAEEPKNGEKAWKKRVELDEKEEQRKFELELAKLEQRAKEDAIKCSKSVRLNIEKNPRSKQESKQKKEREVELVKQMCSEVRETVKLDEKKQLIREERKQDMNIVRSARSFFKNVDRQRSESMNAVPRIRYRTEEEVTDSFSRGNRQRLSQFEPGKIDSKFSHIFEGSQGEGTTAIKPPKKKLITLDQVLRQHSSEDTEPGVQEVNNNAAIRQEISSLHSTPVKSRWKPVDKDGRAEKTQSLDVHRLNVEEVFNNDAIEEKKSNPEITKELSDLRENRPTTIAKRWRPKLDAKGQTDERSRSAHALQRIKLPDDCWVMERSASRLEEERQKAVQELEQVKKARAETLEIMEREELERPSSRAEIETRAQSLRELEEVKRARAVSSGDQQETISRVEDNIKVKLSHEKSIEDSYKAHETPEEGVAQESIKTEAMEPPKVKTVPEIRTHEAVKVVKSDGVKVESVEKTVENTRASIEAAMDVMEQSEVVDVNGEIEAEKKGEKKIEEMVQEEREVNDEGNVAEVEEEKAGEAKNLNEESTEEVVETEGNELPEELKEVPKELSELTMEDIALAVAMKNLDDINGILSRINQPDSEDKDLEDMKSEMETLVDAAAQIEANLEDIDNMNTDVEICIDDFDHSEDDFDDEINEITTDIVRNGMKGPSPFEPGRISDIFKRRFESPTVEEDCVVSHPKKRLISFDQVMRRTPNPLDEMRDQREAEIEEVKHVRRSWHPPDQSDLSFNQITKSATVPDKLKIKHVYGNDKKVDPEILREERSKELRELKKSGSGDLRKRLGQGDTFWVRENTPSGGDDRSKTQAELSALRQARLMPGEDVGPLYSTRQEEEEKARLKRELAELRNNHGSNVRNIKMELEKITEGIASNEEEDTVMARSFPEPSSHLLEEKKKIWEDPLMQIESAFQTTKPVSNALTDIYATVNKKAKKDKKVDEVIPGPVESSEEITSELKKSDGKIKEKLVNLRKQTEQEMIKMKEKTNNLVGNLKKQREEERDRSRTVKIEEDPESRTSETLRSKSLSRIKHASLRMKELVAAPKKGKKMKKGSKNEL